MIDTSRGENNLVGRIKGIIGILKLISL